MRKLMFAVFMSVVFLPAKSFAVDYKIYSTECPKTYTTSDVVRYPYWRDFFLVKRMTKPAVKLHPLRMDVLEVSVVEAKRRLTEIRNRIESSEETIIYVSSPFKEFVVKYFAAGIRNPNVIIRELPGVSPKIKFEFYRMSKTSRSPIGKSFKKGG